MQFGNTCEESRSRHGSPLAARHLQCDVADKNLMRVKSHCIGRSAKVKTCVLFVPMQRPQESDLPPAAGLGYPKASTGSADAFGEGSPQIDPHSSYPCRREPCEHVALVERFVQVLRLVAVSAFVAGALGVGA